MAFEIPRDDCVPYRNMIASMFSSISLNNPGSKAYALEVLRTAELSIFNGSRYFDQDREFWVIKFETDADYTMFSLKWS